MQSEASGRRLSRPEDVRHLLRRVAFAATEELETALTGLTVDEALDVLVDGAKRAPRPVPPPFVLTEWINSALLFTDRTAREYNRAFAAQDAAAQAAIERLRHWWLQEMVTGPAPLRENLALFLHGTLGSTTGSVNMPQALHARNDRLRRGCAYAERDCPADVQELDARVLAGQEARRALPGHEDQKAAPKRRGHEQNRMEQDLAPDRIDDRSPRAAQDAKPKENAQR